MGTDKSCGPPSFILVGLGGSWRLLEAGRAIPCKVGIGGPWALGRALVGGALGRGEFRARQGPCPWPGPKAWARNPWLGALLGGPAGAPWRRGPPLRGPWRGPLGLEAFAVGSQPAWTPRQPPGPGIQLPGGQGAPGGGGGPGKP